MKKTVRRAVKYLLSLALFFAVFQAGAEFSTVTEPDTPADATTLVSADRSAVLRISCLGGNSLFISFAVPSGGFKAGTLVVAGQGSQDTRWIADGQAGRRVNIAYAATPRQLARGLILHAVRRLVFTGDSGPGYTFATKGLPVWLQALPAACR